MICALAREGVGDREIQLDGDHPRMDVLADQDSAPSQSSRGIHQQQGRPKESWLEAKMKGGSRMLMCA